jgi:hypothetical protein
MSRDSLVRATPPCGLTDGGDATPSAACWGAESREPTARGWLTKGDIVEVKAEIRESELRLEAKDRSNTIPDRGNEGGAMTALAFAASKASAGSGAASQDEL